jgi:hypothetical protein
MNNVTNLIAAAVNLDIDYQRMTQEMLTAMNNPRCTKFKFAEKVPGAQSYEGYSLFLRESSETSAYGYRDVKAASFDTWKWAEDLDIPYTRTVIDALPFNPLGTARIIYFPDVPCIKHTDWDDPTDIKHTLGLSIIPSTGNTHCEVWSENLGKSLPVYGHAMLLNDSIPHWVPKANGIRMTIRLFGEIDYDWFMDRVDQENCYYS